MYSVRLLVCACCLLLLRAPAALSGPPSISYAPPTRAALAGTEFLLFVTVEDDADSTLSVSIHQRRGDEPAFASQPMLRIGDTDRFLHVVPGTLLGSSGYAFYFSASDDSSTITLPANAPEATPFCLDVVVSSVDEPVKRTGGRYRMFSSPIAVSDGRVGSVFGVLGVADHTRWRLSRWVSGGYVEHPRPDDLLNVVPGRGFWLITADDVQIGGISGTSTCLTDPVVVRLEPGWNQIGCPFDFPVDWSDVVTAPQIGQPYHYAAALGDYEVATQLVPWDGYFVENPSVAVDSIVIPPKPALINPTARRDNGRWSQGELAGSRGSPTSWSVTIDVTAGTATGAFEVGFHPNARDGRDRYDVVLPPLPPTTALEVAVYSETATNDRRRFVRNIVPVPSGLGTWRLRVSGESAWSTLRFRCNELGVGRAMMIVEDATGVPREIQPGGSTVFGPLRTTGRADGGRSFTLIAGDREAVVADERVSPGLFPASTRLAKTFPNPAHPATMIVFDVEVAATTRLEVYDARGVLIRRITSSMLPRGRHTRLWDGETAGGIPAPNGIYFIRLTSAGTSDSRKIALVR